MNTSKLTKLMMLFFENQGAISLTRSVHKLPDSYMSLIAPSINYVKVLVVSAGQTVR